MSARSLVAARELLFGALPQVLVESCWQLHMASLLANGGGKGEGTPDVTKSLQKYDNPYAPQRIHWKKS